MGDLTEHIGASLPVEDLSGDDKLLLDNLSRLSQISLLTRPFRRKNIGSRLGVGRLEATAT